MQFALIGCRPGDCWTDSATQSIQIPISPQTIYYVFFCSQHGLDCLASHVWWWSVRLLTPQFQNSSDFQNVFLSGPSLLPIHSRRRYDLYDIQNSLPQAAEVMLGFCGRPTHTPGKAAYTRQNSKTFVTKHLGHGLSARRLAPWHFRRRYHLRFHCSV